MINPLHILAIMSVIAGWHIDHVDAELMERNQHKLHQLNIPTDEPVIIDDERKTQAGECNE